MKTFISILLFGLLVLSGCSDNDDSKSTLNPFDGQAIPVDPFRFEDAIIPSFEWIPVQLATRYRLLVQEAIEDSTTQDTTETYVIDEWFTAAEAGCDSEESLCIVTPEMELEGTYTWTVLACTDDGCSTEKNV